MNNNLLPTDLLTVKRVAEKTSASEQFWRGQVRKRGIRSYRIGDLVRISEADLQAWLAARATEAAK